MPELRCNGQIYCPGFGQDRLNFHRTPGRGTAGGWGLTLPGQTEPGIPYHVPSRWVPVGRAARRELSLTARERAVPVWSKRAGLFLSCFLLICIVVVPVSLCFAVLLNCPYPDPPVSASFHFPPHAGGWRGGRVALLLPAAAETKTYIQVQSCSLKEHHFLALDFKERLFVPQATLMYKKQYRNISDSVQRALMFLHFI